MHTIPSKILMGENFDELQVICHNFHQIFINILTNMKSVMLYLEKLMMDIN